MQGGDITSDVFKMSVETLAISFTELKAKSVTKAKVENLTGINYKSGKTLFRKFVKENRKANTGPSIANSITQVRFGGFLQDPLTLLLQGDPTQLQNVRNAWIHCNLKAPAGYRIDFVGDVTRIAARPLVKGNLVPLEEAICLTIQNIVSVGKVATQSAISNELTRTAPDMHFPNRQLIHETLGNLIRGRKVYCTGRGYHLVTTGTYSATDGSKCRRTRASSQNSCEIGLMRKTHLKGDESRDCQRNEHVAEHSKGNIDGSVEGSSADAKSNYHGWTNEARKNDVKKKKRGQRSKSVDDAKRSSIVDRVSKTLFQGCSRGGSRTLSKSGGSPPITAATEDTGVIVKGSPSDDHRVHENTLLPTGTCSSCGERNSIVQLCVPDVIPEKHRHKISDLNPDDGHTPAHDGYSKFCQEPLLYSHALTNQRDVQVSCIPGVSPDTEMCGHHRLTRHESLIRKKYASISIPLSNYHNGNFVHATVSRNRPNDRMRGYHSDTHQSLQFSPQFRSSTRKSADQRRVRRSMSSVSERNSNYLHSCYFAPNVRVGSVIAGHLTELDRSRKYHSIQSEDESSLLSSETFRSRQEYTGDVISIDDFDLSSETDSPSFYRGCREETSEQDITEEFASDKETKAAVEVAKRLAKLNIKMTRDEWRDYFSYKILPKAIEEILQQSDSKGHSDLPRRGNQTYFENTSSSLETVIEVQQRKPQRCLHTAAHHDLESNSPSQQVQNYSKITAAFSNHGQSNVKARDTANCCENEEIVNASSRFGDCISNSPVSPDARKPAIIDDSNTVLFYTCERGHKHFPLCHHHSRIESPFDNASLTEDSGFHTPRERGSYSARDGSRPPRGTFV